MDLFEKSAGEYYRENAPLADRMRPRALEEFFGQEEVVGPGRFLRCALEGDRVPSLIFWGPPGSGKTTLAHIAAAMTGKRFVAFSAVTAGVKEVKRVIAEARHMLATERRGTILFIDEIHRFNRAQQDAFLPSVEDGTITLIGATTENPSFEVNAPLLSRCQVVVLKALGRGELKEIMEAALSDGERGLGAMKLTVADDSREFLLKISRGDARALLNFVELSALKALQEGKKTLDLALVESAVARRALLYDKSGEEHYNVVSALHKSMRDSDPDAALYWLGRMLQGGEDPIYIARRMVRFASEDVGVADPQALVLAVSAMQAVHLLGMPECDTALAQLAIYLATAPKSNSAYASYGRVKREIEESGPQPVPLHIRNAPTRLMEEMGYGRGYKYAHDHEEGFVAQEHLPESLAGKKFYRPREIGFEREILKRLRYWRNLAEKMKKEKEGR